MKAKIYLLTISLFVVLTSCTSSDDNDYSVPFTGGIGIYKCGQDVSPLDGTNAKMFKDEKVFNLANGMSDAKTIAVNGNDVYVAGSENSIAKIWKNGIGVNLVDDVNTLGVKVLDMVVVGVDVYVVGYGSKKNTNGNAIAFLWKNGAEISLTDGKSNGYANSVFVVGTDVYVGGRDNNTATIWKNGIPIKLTDGLQPASINDVKVVGNDIYAIGFDDYYIAKFWKNGIATNLSDGTTQVNLKRMAVIGADVYIGGEENSNTQRGVAKMWKNGVSINLTDGTIWAYFSSMFVDAANNIYMVTNEPVDNNNVTCKIWKNGVVINKYNNYQFINDIFVVPN